MSRERCDAEHPVLRHPTCERMAAHRGSHEAMHTVERVATGTKTEYLLTWVETREELMAESVDLTACRNWWHVLGADGVTAEWQETDARDAPRCVVFRRSDALLDARSLFWVVVVEPTDERHEMIYGPTTEYHKLIGRIRSDG